MRGGLRALGLVAALLALALALPLAAPLAAANGSGVVYLPPSVQMKAVYEKTVLSGYAVEAPAGQDTNADGVVDTPGVATVDLSQYIPAGMTVEAVVVRVENASGDATLKALDSGGNVLATASIVPLSSGYEVTLPAGTTQLQIENLAAQVWSGVITVIVLSSIDVELQFQTTNIEVQGGQAIVPATIVVRQLPADGSLGLQDDKADFVVEFTDPADADGDGKTDSDKFIFVRAHSDPANPASYSVAVRITTSAPPGTYTVSVKMYYHEGTQLSAEPLEIGGFSLTVTLQGDGAGEAVVEEQPSEGEGIDWVMLGVGAIAALAIIFFLAGRR